jgi:predicted PurR-regulated permease PerM
MNSDNKKVQVAISNNTMLRALGWIFIAILAYKFVGRITHALTLIFVSFFLAMALNPVVSRIAGNLKSRSRGKATATAYLLVIAIIIGFFFLVIPPLVNQSRQFVRTVPQTVDNFQKQDSTLARTVRRYKLNDKLNTAAHDFTSHYGNLGTTVLDTGRRIAEAVVSTIVVLVLTFMMLVEGPRWLDLYWGSLPSKKREHHHKLAHRMYKAVNGFVNGQVILAAVAGVFAFIALEIGSRIFNVSVSPLALAGIVAVFDIIPLLGNPISSTLVILICMLSSFSFGLFMLIYFLIYYFIENHTFQPLIQAKLNELTPLMVLVAALIGVGFGGLLGAIVAIPAASAVKILVEDHYERRNASKAPTEDIKPAR